MDLLPPAAGEVGAAVGLEAYAFGFEQFPLPRPSGDGAACTVDDPVAGQTRRSFGERATHAAGMIGHADQPGDLLVADDLTGGNFRHDGVNLRVEVFGHAHGGVPWAD